MLKIESVKIGKERHTFAFEGKDIHECIMKARKYMFQDVLKCGKCGNDRLKLVAYITKEDSYEYVKIFCEGCNASLTFGQPKKEPDVYYLRKNEEGELAWKDAPPEK